MRDRLRVLLVSGQPYPGLRVWRNLLKADPAVDLVHFTILRPPEKQDGTPINQLSLIAFPTRELFQEKLDQFDLIIFDRYKHRGILRLGYYDNIARYVNEHGGAVLIAAGGFGTADVSSGITVRSGIGPGIGSTVRSGIRSMIVVTTFLRSGPLWSSQNSTRSGRASFCGQRA